jgi:DNA-binding CsgD family transcriptional regulator/tetratricopeptide (TPR) repeat protein
VPVRVSSVDFIGRAAELAALEAALARAAEGQAGAVLIGGDAGIGKSRLVTEFDRRATAGGARVLVGECVDLAGGELPYGPVVAALRPLVGDPDGPAASLPPTARTTLSRLWPALAGNAGAAADSPEFGQGQLFEALHDLLARAAADQPVALIIEDLQWADRSTRDLLTFLIRNSRGQRILFVTSYRSDELHRGHQLYPFITELERAGGAERLELPPLAPAEVAAQLAGILGEQPESWLAARLAERSGGNPFFAEELLAAADEGPMPESLRDAMLMRVERLSPAARDVLAQSATAGRSVGHALLAAATSLPPAELAGALREAIAHRVLLAATNGSDYEFRHALMREAVYADLLPGERIALHAQLGAAIQADPSLAASGNAVAELAYHWHAAGDAERGLPASLEAAAAAERSHAYAETLLHLERALELWNRVPPEQRPDTAEAEISRRAAIAANNIHESRRAVVLERRVLELLDDPIEKALSHARLGRYLFIDTRADEALVQYQAAVDLVPPEPPSLERAQVLAAYAQLLMLDNRMAEARPMATEALEMARRADAPVTEANALNTLGPAIMDEYVDEAIAGIRRARELAEAHGSIEEIGRSYINESHSLVGAGRLAEAVQVSLEGIDRAGELGVARGWGAFLRADLAARYRLVGDWDRAIAMARQTLDLVPGDLNSATALTEIGRITAERGEFDEAAEALSRSERMSSRAGPQWSLPNYIGFGLLELWRGDLTAAVDALRRGVKESGSDDLLVDGAELHSLYTRALVDSALRARLLGRDAEAAAFEAEAREHAAGLPALVPNGSGLALVSAELPVAEAEVGRLDPTPSADRWLAMVELFSGFGHPQRVAYAQWRAAEALIAAGERGDDVRDLLDAAGAEAERLGARPLADEIAALARRAQLGGAGAGAGGPVADTDRAFGLTAREHDVLLLVAAGKTNREIGGELYMSEKTASVHVSRILQKLGVTNRVEAAGLAHTLGLRGQ